MSEAWTDTAWMSPGEVRDLSAGERAIAAALFGDHFDPRGCTVAARTHPLTAPLGRPTIMVRGARIFWPAPAPVDCAAPGDPRVSALMAHELVHLWQYQAGRFAEWRYALSLAPFRYRYRWRDGLDFNKLGYEQQASFGEDYWRLRNALPARWTATPRSPADYRDVLGQAFPARVPVSKA